MNTPRPIAIVLWPFSLVYGAAARLRRRLYAHGWLKQERLNGLVISVGNLTTGGTGKTPMVMWLAERFLAEGKRVAILSRGYRGSGGTSDEVELMRRCLRGRVLFGVGQDRFSEGRRLEPQGVDLFLLDDGFQHMQLARDVDIVLIDRSRELREEFVLPAGRLREPISALGRADCIVFTRVEYQGQAAEMIPGVEGVPLFSAVTRLTGFRKLGADQELLDLLGIGPSPSFAFCGIGNPEGFFADLKRWKIPLAGQMVFRDHHRYGQKDIRNIERAAVRCGASSLITTEKDAQNLGGVRFDSLGAFSCVIELEIARAADFVDAIRRKMEMRVEATA
jgi:tetraacyldisaccharide 4'-kinase